MYCMYVWMYVCIQLKYSSSIDFNINCTPSRLLLTMLGKLGSAPCRSSRATQSWWPEQAALFIGELPCFKRKQKAIKWLWALISSSVFVQNHLVGEVRVRPALQEESHDVAVAPVGRPVQWGVASLQKTYRHRHTLKNVLLHILHTIQYTHMIANIISISYMRHTILWIIFGRCKYIL